MTLPLVASELGLAPRAVSYYFRRKEDLAAACYRKSIDRLDGQISLALREPTAARMLRAFIAAFFDTLYQVQSGNLEPNVWFEDMRTIQDAESGKAFTDVFRKVRSIFAAPGAPALSRTEQNTRAHLLLSQLFWSVLWIPRYNPEDYARMGQLTHDILVSGIAVPGTRWSPPILAPDPESLVGPTLLSAATDLINERGYLGASVNRISARLNLTKGAFYHHNDTKSDFVEQCFERTWDIMRRTQASADLAAKTGLMNLAAQAVALVAGQVSRASPLLRTSALAAVPEEIRPSLLAGFDRTTLRYASVIGDGIADGSIRAADSYLAAQIVSGAINAAAELRYWAPGLTAENAGACYVRAVFFGLLSKPN